MSNETFKQIQGESSIHKEQLRQKSVDAIIICSGSAIKRSSEKSGNTRFSSTAFWENDTRNNLSWGKLRMVAGVELAVRFPSAKVVTLCWSVDMEGNRSPEVADSQILGRELMGHGVRKERLMVNDDGNPQAFDTFTEMLETKHLCLENSWNRVLIVGPYFQQERAQEMLVSLTRLNGDDREQIERQLHNYSIRFPKLPFETIKYFYNLYKNLCNNSQNLSHVDATFVPAEAATLLRGERHSTHRYGHIIDVASLSQRYQNEMANGAKGAEDWRNHTYGKPVNVIFGKLTNLVKV